MISTAQGFTDEAALQDTFQIKKYIEGLTKFIENCNTPMTISIQGSWGTGKSSLMQIIQNKLKEQGYTQNIWFNTWQFSQFNLEQQLPLVMLSKLLSALDDDKSSKAKEVISKLAISIGRIAIGHFTGGASDGKEMQEEFSVDVIEQIDTLKQSFQSLVNAKAGVNGRVVIFVDDLDRLEPRKAVELLEVLKLFLDCKNCVFVLAIDYDVVLQGVKAKYGNDMGAAKGRSFFDKIIQVPFKMPVAEYNIKNYVVNCFEQIGMPCLPAEIDTYVELIKQSIGTNPRSMKRLFNAYLLLTIVVTEEVLEHDKNKQLLFAVLCLQHSSEKTYNYIVSNRKTVSMDTFRILMESDTQTVNQQLDGIKISEDELAKVQPFMKLFVQVVDANGDSTLSDKEIENLRNVLGISTITAQGEETKVSRVKEVDDITELELEGNDAAALNDLVSKVQAIDSVNIKHSYRKGAYSHIQLKTAGGKTFTDIYMRKNAFAIDCVAVSALVFEQEDIRDIVRKYGLKVQPYSGQRNYVAFRVSDEQTIQDYLEVVRACYESYKA